MKFDHYERSGVREYWVVDPAAWSVWVYHLAKGFAVDLVELFADLD